MIPYADPDTWVTIGDPEDPMGLPVFDGFARDAADHLTPGTYVGTDGFGNEYAVEVR